MYKSLILLLAILILTYYLTRPSTKDPICKRIYIDKDIKQYMVLKKVLSPKFCSDFIKDAEEIGKRDGWMEKRHKYYPTTDLQINNKWKGYKVIDDLMKTIIYPKVMQMFKVKFDDITLHELFIIKYDVSGQKMLKYHEDWGEFSFIVGLNNEYEGGGTQFKHNGETIRLDIGDCLIFCGQNTHRGKEILSGKRYILTGFLTYKEQDYCKKYLK